MSSTALSPTDKITVRTVAVLIKKYGSLDHLYSRPVNPSGIEVPRAEASKIFKAMWYSGSQNTCVFEEETGSVIITIYQGISDAKINQYIVSLFSKLEGITERPRLGECTMRTLLDAS